jgi:hypothetical protein
MRMAMFLSRFQWNVALGLDARRGSFGTLEPLGEIGYFSTTQMLRKATGLP